MARLASQAKMGYFPTPPDIIDHIKTGLSLPGPGHYRLLDTCCGEGKALAQLAAGLSEVTTYGVELDEQRFKTASQKLHHVVWGDALNELKISTRSFSLLWLNPPYDWHEDGGRLETQFLWAHRRYLVRGGWLVFIIPHRALRDAAESLSKLANLQIYAFTKPDYDMFKQVVVLAQNKDSDNALQLAVIKSYAAWHPEEVWERLPKTNEIPPGSIVLPSSPDRQINFSSERLDMEKAAAIVAKSPLWPELEAATAAKNLHDIRPLAPLRQGHLAMLLAGGLMNGEVEKDGRRLVIKGSVEKKVETETEVTNTHLIERQKLSFQVVIRAIDLNAKEIITIS